MKKIIAAFLLLIMAFSLGSMAFADSVDQRVTIGADLTAEQRAQIYKDFGLAEGEIEEIKVTNSDERAILAGAVDEKKIGSVALSCTYITLLSEGEGLTVITNNINYCTADMYKNALITVGIVDARVIVSAPFPVSGTGALTGIYKAYEAITGTTISQVAKEVSVEELVLTGELAEYIGSDEATSLINELKLILDQTQNMTDEEVLQQIDILAEQYKVSLTDSQKKQLLQLCRSMEKLDVNGLREKLLSFTGLIEKMTQTKDFINSAGEKVSGFVESVKEFFAKIGNFFKNLFG